MVFIIYSERKQKLFLWFKSWCYLLLAGKKILNLQILKINKKLKFLDWPNIFGNNCIVWINLFSILLFCYVLLMIFLMPPFLCQTISQFMFQLFWICFWKVSLSDLLSDSLFLNGSPFYFDVPILYT